MPPIDSNDERQSFWFKGQKFHVFAGGSDEPVDPPADPPPADPPADPVAEAEKARKEAEKKRKDAERRAKAAEKEAQEARERLAQIDDANKSEHEKALEQARADAAEQARQEERSKTRAALVRAELRAAAVGVLHDPDDAVAFISVDDIEVSGDGSISAESVKKAVAELAESKPHLARKGTPPGPGDGGHGPRGERQPHDPKPKADPNKRLEKIKSTTGIS